MTAKAVDIQRAQRVIDFIETLRTPDGTRAGEPFRLYDWQKHIIRQVYGPCNEEGLRQVKEALLSIPRKNGKTCLVSSLCLVHLCGPEAIRNGQLYSLSIDREQAGILFNYAKNMVYADEELKDQLNVIESRKHIVDPVSGSRYMVLSGEKKGKMGKSSSVIFFDELAEFGADRSLYDALMTSRGAHAEPLVWVFSTQAPSDLALLSELIDYGEKVNRGEITDKTFKSFLYAADDEANPWDEKTWFDCNPALGVFQHLDVLRDEAAKAQVMPSAEISFRNLHLNQRIDSSEHFLTPGVWKSCGGKPSPEDLQQGRIYAGLDLSGKNDLTSLILDAVHDNAHNIFPYFWTPGDNITERADRDRVPYVTWRDQGYLEAKSGKTIDYRWVAQQIAEIHAEYHIDELRFDRWRIEDFQRELNDLGVDSYIKGKEESSSSNALCLVPFGQGYKDMSPAVEAIEDAITEGKVRHGNHPVLTMCAANVVVQKDPAGSRKFAKDKSTGRIDGMVAMGMAMSGAELPEREPEVESYTAQHGVMVL